MIIICSPRASGKTTKLLKIAQENRSYIVCRDRNEVSRLWGMILEREIDLPMPITMDELITGQFHPAGVKSIVVDNAEVVIEKLARGAQVKAISINKE